jgi:signal transduction histidine kinase
VGIDRLNLGFIRLGFAYKLRIEAYRTQQTAMFPFDFDTPAIATETQEKANHVTPDDIQLPLTWITGGLLTILGLGVSLIWWVSRMKFTLEEAQKRLDKYEKQVLTVQEQEQKQRIELRDGLRADLRRDISDSAKTIMGELRLFTQEMRQNIKNLSEKLEGRDATVNRQGQKIEHIHNEMIGMAKQLQKQNIAIHYRMGDNGPPSQPHNYDVD